MALNSRNAGRLYRGITCMVSAVYSRSVVRDGAKHVSMAQATTTKLSIAHKGMACRAKASCRHKQQRRIAALVQKTGEEVGTGTRGNDVQGRGIMQA